MSKAKLWAAVFVGSAAVTAVACGGGGGTATTGSHTTGSHSTGSAGTGGATTASSGGTGGATTASTGTGGSKTAGARVFLIMMENHNWGDIKGSASAPYINGLLTTGAHAEQYFNPSKLHPSEPNYIWLEAGDNLGVFNDLPPSINHLSSKAHLVTQLEKAGRSWKAYQEDISGMDCPLVGVGNYAPKHNPMIFFDDVTDGTSATSAHCIKHVRPYTELAADLTGDKVSDYNFITPNLCNDTHDSCPPQNDPIKQGDDWLKAEVPKILASKAYTDGAVILITWDESELGDFPIGMIALGKSVNAGHTSSIAYDHSSTLRTVQEILGVSPFLGGAATATDLADLFTTFPAAK